MTVSHEMLVTEGDPAEIFPDVPSEPKFDAVDSDFLEAEAIEKIAVALLEKRPLPEALRQRTFVYLWQRKGGKSHGKAVLGRCRRPRGLLAKFCESDFIITVSADHVAAARLTRFQMEALVFHELCHAAYDPEDGNYLLPHDYEGFCLEVTIYGAWRPDLEKASLAFKQLSLL